MLENRSKVAVGAVLVLALVAAFAYYRYGRGTDNDPAGTLDRPEVESGAMTTAVGRLTAVEGNTIVLDTEYDIGGGDDDSGGDAGTVRIKIGPGAGILLATNEMKSEGDFRSELLAYDQAMTQASGTDILTRAPSRLIERAGTIADLRTGQIIEAAYYNASDANTADHLFIRAAAPPVGSLSPLPDSAPTYRGAVTAVDDRSITVAIVQLGRDGQEERVDASFLFASTTRLFERTLKPEAQFEKELVAYRQAVKKLEDKGKSALELASPDRYLVKAIRIDAIKAEQEVIVICANDSEKTIATLEVFEK